MRTTLTLDDDVAAMLERVRKTRRVRLKELVNQALREGLSRLDQPHHRKERYKTVGVDLGACLVGSLDNSGELLALAEGDGYK